MYATMSVEGSDESASSAASTKFVRPAAPLPDGWGRTADDVGRSSAATTPNIINGRRRQLGGAPTLKDVNDGEKNPPRSGAV